MTPFVMVLMAVLALCQMSSAFPEPEPEPHRVYGGYGGGYNRYKGGRYGGNIYRGGNRYGGYHGGRRGGNYGYNRYNRW